MENSNQSVKTCILKVDLKCCTGCQKKASMKLQSISGVNEVEYNSEKGLMTVTGDVEPMALVRKLNKCGKKTELFSVKYQLDDDDLNSDDGEDSSSDTSSSYSDPKTMEREIQEKMKQMYLPKKKSSLLGCFSSKPNVVQPLPMRNRNWHIPSKFDNRPPGFGFPFPNATASSQLRPPYPMMSYPPMMQQPPPPAMLQQQPQVPITGAAMPYNVNMFQPPYFMTKQGQTAKVNPRLHYGESQKK